MSCNGTAANFRVHKNNGKKILRPGSKLKRPFTLADLVKDYLEEVGYFGIDKTLHEQHEDYLDSLTDMTDWICGVVNDKKIPDGPPYKVDVHQRYLRVKKFQPLINLIPNKLINLKNEKFKNFEEIYEFVKKSDVKGFGATAYYDFALRYGWHQNPKIKPDEKIYVHSKPGLAAKSLKDKGYIEVEISNPMKREDFPEEIKNSKMDAADIEHFLCIYKKLISELPIKK